MMTRGEMSFANCVQFLQCDIPNYSVTSCVLYVRDTGYL